MLHDGPELQNCPLTIYDRPVIGESVYCPVVSQENEHVMYSKSVSLLEDFDATNVVHLHTTSSMLTQSQGVLEPLYPVSLLHQTATVTGLGP